jgi:hypothetical protein
MRSMTSAAHVVAHLHRAIEQRTLPCPAGKLHQQARLADARLTSQPHHTRLAAFDLRERPVKRRQLLPAPHQSSAPLGHIPAYPATTRKGAAIPGGDGIGGTAIASPFLTMECEGCGRRYLLERA